MMSRVWGRHAPTRSLRKCRRIAEVKSRMDRKFSRIENLWPRDGSCPLPLRSKRIFNKCFRIVKTQKTSRGCSAHVMGSPFAPNEVPAPVCAAALTESRYHVRSAHEIFKVQLPKRKIPPTQRSDDFVGVNRRQNESGVLRGGTFFPGNHPLKVVVITVRTTTFSKIWNKGYHGSVGASRWFCKIYCGKAVVVGLICVVCSKSHIVTICFFAIYG